MPRAPLFLSLSLCATARHRHDALGGAGARGRRVGAALVVPVCVRAWCPQVRTRGRHEARRRSLPPSARCGTHGPLPALQRVQRPRAKPLSAIAIASGVEVGEEPRFRVLCARGTPGLECALPPATGAFLLTTATAAEKHAAEFAWVLLCAGGGHTHTRTCSTSPGVSARSTMMTSALAVNVMPTPPAPHVKTNAAASGSAGSWKRSTSCTRSFCGTSPVSKAQFQPADCANTTPPRHVRTRVTQLLVIVRCGIHRGWAALAQCGRAERGAGRPACSCCWMA